MLKKYKKSRSFDSLQLSMKLLPPTPDVTGIFDFDPDVLMLLRTSGRRLADVNFYVANAILDMICHCVTEVSK